MKNFSLSKTIQLAVIISALSCIGAVYAADITLADGSILRNADISKITTRGLVVTHAAGISYIRPKDLPPSGRKRFAKEFQVMQQMQQNEQSGQVLKRHRQRIQKMRANVYFWEKLQQKIDMETARLQKLASQDRYRQGMIFLSKLDLNGAMVDISALKDAMGTPPEHKISSPAGKKSPEKKP